MGNPGSQISWRNLSQKLLHPVLCMHSPEFSIFLVSDQCQKKGLSTRLLFPLVTLLSSSERREKWVFRKSGGTEKNRQRKEKQLSRQKQVSKFTKCLPSTPYVSTILSV